MLFVVHILTRSYYFIEFNQHCTNISRNANIIQFLKLYNFTVFRFIPVDYFLKSHALTGRRT